MPRPSHTYPFLALAAAVLAAAGCGDSTAQPKLSPVRGKVFQNGKPVEKVSVHLHPVGFAVPDTAGATPSAKTDAIGAFHLIPGVPPGKYQVTIEKSKKAKTKAGSAAAGTIPDRFADPAKSGLEVDILPGSNELPTFEIN